MRLRYNDEPINTVYCVNHKQATHKHILWVMQVFSTLKQELRIGSLGFKGLINIVAVTRGAGITRLLNCLEVDVCD